ncbi:MAG TPA: hypothetical protein VIK54_10765 [Acidimicrobiia bacterium]
MAEAIDGRIAKALADGLTVAGVVVVGGTLVGCFASVVEVVGLRARCSASRTVCRSVRCVVFATATDPVAATKSKTARNQAV